MSEEFKDYYMGILKSVRQQTDNIPYADALVKRNYFRIKTGFYEDENPETIVEDLVFNILENMKRKEKLLTEGVFDFITDFFKSDSDEDNTAEELNRYLDQIQDILDENEVFDERITKQLGELRDSDYINFIDFPTTIRGLQNKFLKPGEKTEVIYNFFNKLLTSLPERAEYEEKISQSPDVLTFDDVDDYEDEEQSKIPRKRYKKEFIKFLTYALASSDETKVHLNFLFDCGYIPKNIYKDYYEKYEFIGRQIYNLMESFDKMKE